MFRWEVVMDFRFDFDRTVQAAAVLLEYDRARRLSYLRLLKLLYVADRETLLEKGRPITGDRAVARKLGPVLSHVYDLVRGQSAHAGEWDHYVHTDGYQVELVNDPGRGRLSPYDANKLREVSDRYRNLDDWQLCEVTHGYGEWAQHYAGGDSSSPIPWEDVLAAAGRGDLVEEVARHERTRQYYDDFFKE
jgi:uncharacterized phage-associated protein